jgi:hypothetical protein
MWQNYTAVTHVEERVAEAEWVDPNELSERDQAILAFEREWWKHVGAKEHQIRERFDVSATRYYQILNELIDSPAALREDPMLVRRLQRMRSARQRQRVARRLGLPE